MSKHYVLLKLVASSIISFLAFSPAQAVATGETYSFRGAITLSRVNPDGSAHASPGTITSNVGERFDVVFITSSVIVVQIVDYKNFNTDAAQMALQSARVFDTGSNTSYYWAIPVGYFDVVAQRFYRYFDFDAGTLTMPIKMRLGSSSTVQLPNGNFNRLPDFTSSFNAGFSVGPQLRFGHHSNSTLSLLAGASITEITINSYNTLNYVSQETEHVGVSGHISLVGHINNTYIVGALGWDVLGGLEGQNWGYNKAPWIGFGFGVNLFESNSTATATNP